METRLSPMHIQPYSPVSEGLNSVETALCRVSVRFCIPYVSEGLNSVETGHLDTIKEVKEECFRRT